MTNRLARETSPYLRQHADNPVDWYPWDDEALERARAEDRPILLSIGYSACHWCHVMERESFADPEVARFMNEGFVNVKVDREERPDVDTTYMRAVQALTGRGGWPLTVFLTPEGRPFYGGTYFPPEPRHGMPSFRQVLDAALAAWRERRGEVEDAAGQITEILEKANRREADPEGPDPAALDAALLRRAVATLLRQVDPTHGGFGGAPKFPQPTAVEFLLAHHAATAGGAGRPPETAGSDPAPDAPDPAPRTSDSASRDGSPALDAALHTLRAMARGGIRDHLGGGFHRYTVDARWLVPHFEKMLYDNALLATAYLRGYQLGGDETLLEVARETLGWLLEDMRSPEGGFYAARDADSEGEEGKFYLWNREEVDALLTPEEARVFRRCYDVSAAGNFEGRNILHLPHQLEGVARDEGMELEALHALLARARATLLEARRQRVPPARDSKILAGWNGLAFRALAETGAALLHRDEGEPYLEAARKGMEWLLEALRPEGRLLHQVPGEGGRHIPAFLDDVAALGLACLSLHEATLEPRWLEEAVALMDEIDARFGDASDAGETDGSAGAPPLYDTPADGDRLVIRPRELADNAVPSGHSLAAELFLHMGRLLGRAELTLRSGKMVEDLAADLARIPSAFGRLLGVGVGLTTASVEIALVEGEDEVTPLLAEAHRVFLPGRVLTGRRRDAAPSFSTPLLQDRSAVEGRSAAYVCREYACRAPVTSPRELAAELREATRRET
jgi:uncharacterized protein